MCLMNIVLHLDQYLDFVIRDYGFWTHLLLFTIIFCETGFVLTPFLPGDSLLFAVGSFVALGSFDLTTIVSLTIAAIMGDTVNYWIGRKVGPKVFTREGSRFFKKGYLEQTHLFYVRHGGKAIIIARFVPVIRTFAPFVAGIGSMPYRKFFCYNVIGGAAWVAGFAFMGYFFGNTPGVRQHFGVVILAIIFISVVPAVIGFLRRYQSRAV